MQDAHMAPSQYASLPGTNIIEHVDVNATTAKSKLLTSGREIAGCHPSRWIFELLNNSFSECDMFDRARRAKSEGAFEWQHPHRLVINGNQSYVDDSHRVLSSVCLDCHNHLLFKMSWDKDHATSLCRQQEASWPLPDNKFPWHHLTWTGSDSDPSVHAAATKYYPLLAREFFICTSGPCTFELTLEVSQPRLAPWIVDLLQDRDAILATLNIARAQEPTRYEGATDDWAAQAPLNLNTYLKNLLESEPHEVRSISKRNKRFAVLFGPRCFPIFQFLGFEDNVIDREGVDEGNFKPPAPDPPKGPQGTTEVDTYRSFLEDVRSEVQCLIHKAGQSTESPTFCTTNLYADLGSQEVPGMSSNPLVNADQYKALGVLPGQSREIVANAYKRQWDRLPSQRRRLVDSLMAIANDTGDEQLSEYAITQSSVFDSQTQTVSKDDDDGLVSQALAYLGLQPPNNHSADAVLQAFRVKVASAPGDAATARSMLQLIASNSTDDEYQIKMITETDESHMTFDTARAVLRLAEDDNPRVIAERAQTRIKEAKSMDAKVTLLDACTAVAEHFQSPEMKQLVADLRNEHNVRATGPVGHSTDNLPVDWALPVGLNNIGNTCYLNSLLQYLYTVKAVRDVADNYDAFKLELSDDIISERRLGGNKMRLDRGEAVVAQAFVHELRDLFHQLKTSDKAAARPSQRLANAVLLSTDALETAQKAPADASKDSAPPPLPARPSPAPPSAVTQQQDVGDGDLKSMPLQLDLTGNDSAETLVGHEEIDSEPSYEKVEHVSSHTDELSSPSPVVEITNDEVSPQRTIETSDASKDLEAINSPANAHPDNAEDVDMGQADEPESVDKKVLNALEHQTRSSGTDQQDVEEVIGSILNRLQAAIQPSQIDEKTGIQLEKIMETFFVTTVNYTKKFDKEEYQPEVSFDRSITAYPAPDGTCSLYEALGRNFDQFIIEDERLSRYTAIKTLPPVLHVLIQRSQNDGRKNGNAVEIPETLYLDRYMDAAHDSPAFRRRVEDWSIAARIEEIKAQKAQLDTNVSTGRILESIRLGMHAASEQVAGGRTGASSVFDNETWDFDGPVDDDFMLVNPVGPPEPVEDLSRPLPQEKMDVIEKEIQSMIDTELQQREQTLAEHQAASKEVPYRLHAVICHRGHLGSGHYWVWIRDFEENVWRWYNDADVKENKDTDDVLKTLSSSGEPYYLCYVRDSDKDEHVDVPKRQRPEVVEEPTTAVAESQLMPDAPPADQTKDADGDVVVGDSATVNPSQDWGKPQSTAEHVQGDGDVVPAPPPYGGW